MFTMFQGQFKPFDSRNQNQLQLFNEFLISCISYLSILFSDIIINENDKYYFGWAVIGTICGTVIINTILILLVSLHQIKLIYRKYKYKLKKFKSQSIDKFTEVKGKTLNRESTVKMYPHPMNEMIIKVDVSKLSPRW